MSEIVADRAVVLKTFEYGETSLIVSALTRAHGKVRLLAKGARRPRAPIGGALRTGCVCEAVFYYRADRGLQQLKECEGGAVCEGVEGDLERLCILQAGIEIVDRGGVGHDVDERLFDLLEAFLRSVGRALDPWALFYAFEIGVLGLAGALPDTGACSRCGVDLAGERFGVDAASGAVTCAACRGGLLSAEAASFIARAAREGLVAAEGRALERAERREIGELVHRLFAGHVEGYRLPNALRLCRGVNGQ